MSDVVVQQPPEDPAKPGVDMLLHYLRPLTQAMMDHDREAFLAAARNRHAGETLLCLGTGPSLRGFDANLLDNFTTMGCNGIGRFYQPDYYLIADPFIYGLHREVFDACRGMRILSSFTDGECDLRLYYRREDLVGLTRDVVYSADNTGYLQLSIAAVMGARRVVLAGYDGYPPDQARYHCYEEEVLEADRVRWEWRPGNQKEALMRLAFEHAARAAAALDLEIRLLTPSWFLGDLFEPIDAAEMLAR
jgi:hypothetical protein